MLCTSPPSCIRGTHGDIGDAAQVVLAGVQCHVHTLEDEGPAVNIRALIIQRWLCRLVYGIFIGAQL